MIVWPGHACEHAIYLLYFIFNFVFYFFFFPTFFCCCLSVCLFVYFHFHFHRQPMCSAAATAADVFSENCIANQFVDIFEDKLTETLDRIKDVRQSILNNFTAAESDFSKCRSEIVANDVTTLNDILNYYWRCRKNEVEQTNDDN